MTLVKVDPVSVRQYGDKAQTSFGEIRARLPQLSDDVVSMNYEGVNAADFKKRTGQIAAQFSMNLVKDMGAMAEAVRISTTNIAGSLGGSPSQHPGQRRGDHAPRRDGRRHEPGRHVGARGPEGHDHGALQHRDRQARGAQGLPGRARSGRARRRPMPSPPSASSPPRPRRRPRRPSGRSSTPSTRRSRPPSRPTPDPLTLVWARPWSCSARSAPRS